jgi:excisionase family DNA binding protein
MLLKGGDMPGLMTPPKVAQFPETLWTVEDVARFLRCSQRTVYKYIQEEELPYILLSGRYLFDPEEVYKWAKARRHVKQKEG